MSIRIKLLLSYIGLVTIVVTAVLFSAVVMFGAMVAGFFSSLPGVENEEDFSRFVEGMAEVAIELIYEAEHMPEYFNDESYLDDKSEKLEEIYMGLAIVEEGEVVYTSERFVPEGVMEIALTRDLTNYSHNYDSDEKRHMIEIGTKNYIVFATEVGKTNKSYYVVYDVTNPEDYGDSSVRFIGFIILSFIVLLFGTLLVIIHFVIIKPLKKLEYATNQVREGNLDFSVGIKSNDEMGRVGKAFDVMRDELKQSIEKQVAYENSRKELVSSISHDLKTPITSIKGYVEGIRDGVADTDEKKEKYLDVIYTKAQSMDHLIDDLFLFSKLDLNRLPFDMKSVAVKGYFEDCIEEIQLDMQKKDIGFIYNIDIEESCYMVVDPMHLKRVVLNITQNGVKYMDKEHKQMSIDIMVENNNVKVAIADNGVGINKEELDKVFGKFYRTDKSRNTEIGGSGLGLSIAKQIIGQFGGNIYAESSVGVGTTVYFTIPCQC